MIYYKSSDNKIFVVAKKILAEKKKVTLENFFALL